MTSRMLRGLAVLLAAVAALAPAGAAAPEQPILRGVPDADYRDAQVDGPVFMALDARGRTWAVWSYRRGAELDVAVARSVGRTWTAPELIGKPGVDDTEPRIAFAADGTPVVTWLQRRPGADGAEPATVVVVAGLANGAWSAPRAVAQGSAPALFMNGDRITVGFIDPSGQVRTRMILLKDITQTNESGSNGPDPFPGIIKRPPPPTVD